jgi:hypothetical protein
MSTVVESTASRALAHTIWVEMTTRIVTRNLHFRSGQGPRVILGDELVAEMRNLIGQRLAGHPVQLCRDHNRMYSCCSEVAPRPVSITKNTFRRSFSLQNR